MHVKVRDGTVPDSGSSLCTTCRLSMIVRGRSLDEEIVQCHALSMKGTSRVTFKVTSCTAYSDERRPTYLQMMEDAWILQPGSRKRAPGFVRGAELCHEDLATVIADIHRRHEP
jgi:hypothetical protein